jgi:hypothetical protein
MSHNKRKPKRPKLGRVHVRSERRAEPDWDKFAWTLLQYAKTIAPGQSKTGERPPRRGDRP